MFGWEFPPFSSGGLGTACHGLTKGLSNNGTEVTFVIPKAPENASCSHVKLLVADGLKNMSFRKIEISSTLVPYVSSEYYKEQVFSRLARLGKGNHGAIYGKNLFEEVMRYSQQARIIAENEEFDVIHAHDWMTYRAGIEAKKVSGKPLVLHIHATEFDRTGGHPNQAVYDLEREGFHACDRIIAVSNYTKNMVVKHYAVPESKVKVVHNAVEFRTPAKKPHRLSDTDKIVLFLGRITIQKGPDYFLDAAKKVLDRESNVKFVVAGSGDMEGYMIERAAQLGIANKVLFTGFLSGNDVDKAYQMAHLYVMPSVSEPFGIAPLESLRNQTPVLISKQSGVSEVLQNAMKVDFWDTDQMANKIIASVKYPALHNTLRDEGINELQKFSWDDSATRCIEVYHSVLG